MDSLTQIVLGAAVGEAVLGRKIGNRAMVWGAIGGTIPDLDVVTNFFMTDLQSLVFHRGITHSITFSILIPFAVGWLVHKLYATGVYRKKWYKSIITAINAGILGVSSFGVLSSGSEWWLKAGVTLLAGYLGWRLITRYFLGDQQVDSPAYRQWYWLFFWTFITHILLDTFTAYGTQIFQPFSDLRVAFNTISVVDPGYTIPFIIPLICAAFLKRRDPARSFLNGLGIALSSLYLSMTVYNKHHVDEIFSTALQNRDIPVQRCRASPTIFNNILWNFTAETEDAYYLGLYSLYDSNPNIHVLNRIPKNEDLRATLRAYQDYDQLMWFADGYLHAMDADSAIILSDLRFGAVSDTVNLEEDIVFRFFARPDGKSLNIREDRRRPENVAEELDGLMDRILGY